MASKISNGVFIGTCIASFVGTVLCALYAKVPFVQAPGMGRNAFLPNKTGLENRERTHVRAKESYHRKTDMSI